MRLNGKVAIVTGSARGLGKAIAMSFATEGAVVVVSDILIEQACQVVDEIKKQGGAAIALKSDVSNRADVQDLVKSTLENFQAVHILVNNAGIVRNAPLVEMREEDWDMVLNVDLKGVFNCTQAVLGHMMDQRYGKIINISSIGGLDSTGKGSAAYGAAKAGIIQLTKIAAVEVGAYGINVNCIAPGSVRTGMAYTQYESKEEAERHFEFRKGQTVLGRLGEPEEIANLALFLASDDSSYITGQVICCDGGRYGLNVGTMAE